jgi:hypothetical protein
MKIYTISTKSYQPFVKNIESELNKVENISFYCKYIPDLPRNYRHTAFKLKYIHDDIIKDEINNNDQILFVDCTTLFDSSMYQHFLDGIKNKLDIAITKEYNSDSKINIGAMVINCNKNVELFFKKIIDIIENKSSWDQHVFQEQIRKSDLNWDFLDSSCSRVVSSRNDINKINQLIENKSFISKFIRRDFSIESDKVYQSLLNNGRIE